MIKVRFITHNGLYKECEASCINCLSSDGWRGILPNHMPIVLMLPISRLEVKNGNKKDQYAIGGGMIYFENNEANILLDSIEHQDDIDLERASSSKQRAERRLSEQNPNYDLKRAEISLKRALNRISVCNYK